MAKPSSPTTASVVSVVKLADITANTTFSVPAGCAITEIFVQNNTANAGGGINFGTRPNGYDIAASPNLRGNDNLGGGDADVVSIPLRDVSGFFSASDAQTVYVSAAGNDWGGVSIDVQVVLVKIK